MTPAAQLVPAALAVAALAFPLAADAATLSVTDDAGQQAAMTEGVPLQIRNMAPALTAGFSAADKQYSLQVTSPSGKALVERVCVAVGDQTSVTDEIPYEANGTYAIKLVTYQSAEDFYCEGASTVQSYSLVIAASVTISGLTSPLLFRDVGTADKDLTVNYDLNPGAQRYVYEWAYDAKFGANGGLLGEYAKDSYGSGSSGIPTGAFTGVRFPRSGVVSVVAAAETLVGSRSPFSAPLTLKLIAPFDWSSTPSITGGRVGRLAIGGEVYEPTAVGNKVAVLMAKGKGKFKPLTSVTIPSSRRFAFRFKPKKPGKYRLRYVYKGSEFMLPGTWTQTLKINKRRNASISSVKHVP